MEPTPQTSLPASRSPSSCWFHVTPTSRTRVRAIVRSLSRHCPELSGSRTWRSKTRLRLQPTTLMVVPYLHGLGKPSRACESPQRTELLPAMHAARVPPADRTIVVTDPAHAAQIPTTTCLPPALARPTQSPDVLPWPLQRVYSRYGSPSVLKCDLPCRAPSTTSVPAPMTTYRGPSVPVC